MTTELIEKLKQDLKLEIAEIFREELMKFGKMYLRSRGQCAKCGQPQAGGPSQPCMLGGFCVF